MTKTTPRRSPLLRGLVLICLLTLPGIAHGSALTAPTKFVTVKDGRQLAYRSIGEGPPLILCNRFRGTLDTWDPAFLDGLAKRNRVITFNFRGIGRSTGDSPTRIIEMAEDIRDLIDALELERVALAGWSMGGMAAQVFATVHPERLSHLILIGTGPAGTNPQDMEPVFLELAHKPVNDLTDEYTLFFEPMSAVSRRAAELSHERIAQRASDVDVPVPPPVWPRLHQAGAEFRNDLHGSRDMLKRTSLPILILHGDHDIVFPVQNWHALNRELPTAQLIVFPHAGHGPQHQFVEASVAYIHAFLATSDGSTSL